MHQSHATMTETTELIRANTVPQQFRFHAGFLNKWKIITGMRRTQIIITINCYGFIIAKDEFRSLNRWMGNGERGRYARAK